MADGDADCDWNLYLVLFLGSVGYTLRCAGAMVVAVSRRGVLVQGMINATTHRRVPL
jgi:hypothetical protein